MMRSVLDFHIFKLWRFSIVIRKPHHWTWKVWTHLAIGWMPPGQTNAEILQERDEYRSSINHFWTPALARAANRAFWYANTLQDILKMKDIEAIHRRAQEVFDLVYSQDVDSA